LCWDGVGFNDGWINTTRILRARIPAADSAHIVLHAASCGAVKPEINGQM
jgi:hypothetical protein